MSLEALLLLLTYRLIALKRDELASIVKKTVKQ